MFRPSPAVVLDGGGCGGCVSKTTGESCPTNRKPISPLFPNLSLRTFSFSRVPDAVHRYSLVVQAVFARPPTTPHPSLVTHLRREIDQPLFRVSRRTSRQTWRIPYTGSEPSHRPAAVLFVSRARGDEEKERKKKEGKGREGRRGEGREEEGRGERGEKKGWKGKQNERWRGRGGREWTRGWVGGADGNGQQHSRGSPRGKFIP